MVRLSHPYKTVVRHTISLKNKLDEEILFKLSKPEL